MIFVASFRRSPVAPVFACRSLPARSTRLSLPTLREAGCQASARPPGAPEDLDAQGTVFDGRDAVRHTRGKRQNVGVGMSGLLPLGYSAAPGSSRAPSRMEISASADRPFAAKESKETQGGGCGDFEKGANPMPRSTNEIRFLLIARRWSDSIAADRPDGGQARGAVSRGSGIFALLIVEVQGGVGAGESALRIRWRAILDPPRERDGSRKRDGGEFRQPPKSGGWTST